MEKYLAHLQSTEIMDGVFFAYPSNVSREVMNKKELKEELHNLMREDKKNFSRIDEIMQELDQDTTNNPRMVCTYNHGNSFKERIFEFLRTAEELDKSFQTGQKLLFSNPSEWTWDHVVERQHLENFYADNTKVERLYKNQWPCVLTQKFEDRPKTGFMKTNETTKVFLGIDGRRSPAQKSERARELLESLEGRKEMKRMIKDTRTGYANLFDYDPIRRQIATNVLNEVLSQL